MPENFPLNQGNEGACVGFGWAAEFACNPILIKADRSVALEMYESARAEDRAMGNIFPDGASILAGAKAAKKAGHISKYRWAFGIEDVIDTLCTKGPIVLGIPWYESMYETEPGGRIRVNGRQVGGHCILATGYWPDHPTLRTNVIQLMNSWGPTYGQNGVGYISEIELAGLLKQDGEACVASDIEPGNHLNWWQRFLDMW